MREGAEIWKEGLGRVQILYSPPHRHRNAARGHSEEKRGILQKEYGMREGRRGGVRYMGEGEEERRKVTALYLLENEGFHSGKDEGNTLQKQHRDTAVTQSSAGARL